MENEIADILRSLVRLRLEGVFLFYSHLLNSFTYCSGKSTLKNDVIKRIITVVFCIFKFKFLE